MKLKQLLKPNLIKIVLFLVIGFIANIFSLFFSYGCRCIGNICTLCSFWNFGTAVEAINSPYLKVHLVLIGELFIFYLISCLIIYGYEKIKKKK